MKVLTIAQMQKAERDCAQFGLNLAQLMENAGLAVANHMRSVLGDLRHQTIAVLAGPGNNGGDGLVVARHLFDSGARPEVLLLAAKDDAKGDAAINLAVALRMGIPVTEIRDAAAWKKARSVVSRASIVVDALFGTGLVKPLEGLYALAVADINLSDAYKVAVDIPSGVDGDTGCVHGTAVWADRTVTFGLPKLGLALEHLWLHQQQQRDHRQACE